MKNVLLTLGLIFLAATPLSLHADNSILIQNGNVDALRAAIESANANPGNRTTIILTGDFHFSDQVTMPWIDADISISPWTANSRVRFLGPKDGDDPAVPPIILFHVSRGGKLEINNIEIAALPLLNSGEGLIQNEGYLRINRLVITDVAGSGYCMNMGRCYYAPPVMVNQVSGRLEMNQVSIVNSGAGMAQSGGVLSNHGQATVTNTQIYLTEQPWIWSSSFYNTGTLEINNSSFFYRFKNESNLPGLIYSESDADTTIQNSVVANFVGSACEYATSLGFNVNSEADCNWLSTGDITGESTGLMWQPVDANWGVGQPDILTHALVPSAASISVDSANPETCADFDLLGARRSRIDQSCDRGAVETLAAGLGEGGINGLYYNPDADGHYIQILQTDFLTLVIWNTFDLEGNHAWVYGTGQLVDGKAVVAETYINRDAIILPDSPVIDADTEYWGTMEVDMISCTEGTIAFDSVFPEFGSGQFPIARLAYVKQLGCVD